MDPALPPGQNPGQPDWGSLIEALVAEHGSLAALAARLCEGGPDELASAERGLRRLRSRGSLSGGVWGERVLRAFGLPAAIADRLRFMGSYHSRFEDLPVSLAADLVQLWDRPPLRESRLGRAWLGLAQANLALRRGDRATAARALGPALAGPDELARVEASLGLALLQSLEAPGRLPAALAPVEGWLAALSGPDADCLWARYLGQRAWTATRAGDRAAVEGFVAAMPVSAHPFAASRRANAAAHLCFLRGDLAAAEDLAWEAVRTAGDGGHVRLRAMGLLMVARVSPRAETRQVARARARAIGEALEDAVLLRRAQSGGPAIRVGVD